MAETWFIRGEAGTVFELGLPLHEVILHQLHKGSLKRVNEDGTDFAEKAERARPALNAPKVDWVSWAVHSGASVDDAEALTKSDLIERYGV